MNKMVKKILYSFASLFLIYQSLAILRSIHHLETDSFGLLLFLAWIINLFITGVFAFPTFAFPTHKLLPASYYTIRDFNIIKRLYQNFKVDWFRKFLLATLWRNKKQRKGFFDGTREGIEHLEVQSSKAEFGHLLPFIILTVVSIYLLIIGQFVLGIMCMLINIIGNFYPILLQRHHRMRIQLLKIRQKRKGA